MGSGHDRSRSSARGTLSREHEPGNRWPRPGGVREWPQAVGCWRGRVRARDRRAHNAWQLRSLGASSGYPGVGRRADWTPIGALTSCFLLTHRGQHRALNNTDRRGNPLIWLDCGGQQSVLDNKPGCTRWRARSGSRHGRRERDLAGGVGAARPVSIAVSMTFPMRSAAASTSRSLTWA